MASAVQDIIRLGEKLREAQEKVDRLESVEQAIGEAEARLAKLRAEEHRAEADCSRRRVQLNEQEAGAAIQVAAIKRAAEADAAKLRQATLDWCSNERQRALADTEALSDEADGYRKAIAALQDEESRLAQSVAHLRSELEALKARVLG